MNILSTIICFVYKGYVERTVTIFLFFFFSSLSSYPLMYHDYVFLGVHLLASFMMERLYVVFEMKHSS